MPTGNSRSAGLSGDVSGRMARLMFYILLCMVLMTLDFRGRWVDQIRQVGTLIIEPAWVLVEAPFSLGQNLKQRLSDRQELLADHARMARELDESRARLLLMDELRLENERLRRLLDASVAIKRGFQAVELRQIDLNPYSHRVLVDRGARDGLRVGQPVMDAEGLVGQVDRVLVHSASVILLSDPDHALPVEIARSRLRTIAYGSGRSGELRLDDLPMNADVEIGDVLVTSGLGGRFPPGLPVADVISVERSAGEAFAVARAQMRSKLNDTRHLLIVTRPGVSDSAVPDTPSTATELTEDDGS